MNKKVKNRPVADEDSAIKAQMEKMVNSYDKYMKRTTLGKENLLRGMTVDLAEIKSGDCVLEIGCATGTLSGYFSIFDAVKKNLVTILFLVSFLIMVIHEMIPHHHHAEDFIEWASSLQSEKEKDHHHEKEEDHHFPIPNHLHFTIPDDFIVTRTDNRFEKNSSFSVFLMDQKPLVLFSPAKPPKITTQPILKAPISSYPFIISPNAMRGSPSLI